jgi:hypothetical protein
MNPFRLLLTVVLSVALSYVLLSIVTDCLIAVRDIWRETR